MTSESLIARQQERERQQVERGIELYRKATSAQDEGSTTPGQMLVRRALVPMVNAINEMVERTEAGKAGRGRPARALPYLQALQAEPVAYITARQVISAAAARDKMAKTALSIATLIEDHYVFDQLMGAAPKLGRHMEEKAKGWTTEYHRRTIMRLGAKLADVQGLEFSQADKLYLGLKLVELFIESTGLVEQEMTHAGKNNTQYTLKLEARTADWLAKVHGKCELFDPRFTPMVCPPKPWTSPIDGGYLSRENRVDFIGGVSAAMRDDVFSVEMGDVYRAVNAIQSTAWKINTAVLDVMQEAWRLDSQIGGLPARDPLPVPARPADVPKDVPRANLPENLRVKLDEYRFAAAQAHEVNNTLVSKRIAVQSKLDMAEDVRDEAAIYFPHNVDFRGRVYSVVSGLSPQGDDVGKSLIMFSEGKPLGENGAYWLAVHIANLFGVDKVSFDERVEWVLDHTAELLDSAARPLEGQQFWTTADSPWCALAACFEWAGYHAMRDEYVSHLPIAMDGSCSGLQHFSAMLKDEAGGRAVNLTATEQPADLYTAVAERVEEILQTETDQCLISWRGQVTRKIVKRPCMTFAYSVTYLGVKNQIEEELRKATAGGQYLPGWDNFEAAGALTPVVIRAIRETVSRAAEAMDWIKLAIKPVVKDNVFPIWSTPDGFPVQQRYAATSPKRFEVWFQGTRLRVQLRVETTKVDARKQAAAVAPNFVHSMDACHMRLVVNRLVDAGITRSFAMIHDSFGVHACDVDELHYAIRDEFIRLYSDDQLGRFRDQVLASLPMEQHGDVPPCPKAGTLNLEGIRAAEFFFA